MDGLGRQEPTQEPRGARRVRSSGSFAVPQKSSQKVFTCIPHYAISVNKASMGVGVGGLVQNVDASAYLRVFMCLCVCVCVLLNKELPFLRDYSAGAVSQNRKIN